jgi:hypothetical protein
MRSAQRSFALLVFLVLCVLFFRLYIRSVRSTKVVDPAPANGVELFPDYLSDTSSNELYVMPRFLVPALQCQTNVRLNDHDLRPLQPREFLCAFRVTSLALLLPTWYNQLESGPTLLRPSLPDLEEHCAHH